MKEYVTEALVLGLKPYREQDKLADFYTKDLGRLEARVIGGRKMVSKLSPHLDIFNLVTVRLIQKNQFTVTDVIAEERFCFLRGNFKKFALAFKLLFFIRTLIPFLMPDLQLWHSFLRTFKGGYLDFKNFLKILGYDPLLANCQICPEKKIEYFHVPSQSFLCKSCGFKFVSNELLFIK